MSLVKNSTDINIQIFTYLTIEDLLNMYKTNKTILRDIELYTKIKYKKSFKQLYFENKCLHCNNLCDNIDFKICNSCITDTCWTCYNKVGNLNLYFMTNWDFSLNSWYPTYKCINKCIYKCKKCKKNYTNKNYINIKNSIINCSTCTLK